MSHFSGGVLLVAGTTIGAAMLAVPVTTAFMGFYPSLVLLIVCWFFTLLSGFFFVDVNCAYKDETNIISMAGRTLGPFGKILGWIFYMLLLYALLTAYIAGSAHLLEKGAHLIGLTFPSSIYPFALPLLFGSFLYFGTAGVDMINRVLMTGLFISYFVLILFVPKHIDPTLLTHIDFKMGYMAIPVVITAFGYHIIIPSLSTYMHHDKKKLKRCIFWGSLLAFMIYVVWQVLVMGVVPLTGAISLTSAWQMGHDAAEPLATLLNQNWISRGAFCFSFFAIVTSFLGVSLSLSDFLVDGFKIKKTWEGRLGACFLTFVPPLLFVFTYQRGFYLALEHAGAFVAVLLIFLPAAMVYKLKALKKYQTLRGKFLLCLVTLFALLVVISDMVKM
jgi:tyrosine-specific transport protein